MTGFDTLLGLAKSKLNITWQDDGTDARIKTILEDAYPNVSNMVGLSYDKDATEAYERDGTVFDFSAPSMEREMLLNYVAYEWNHQLAIFRETYWDEITACRQQRCMIEVDDGE